MPNPQNCNRKNPYMARDSFCGDIMSGTVPEKHCGRNEWDHCLEDLPLAMAYVPWQSYRDVFECEHDALAHGTIFKELVLEFYGRSCR